MTQETLDEAKNFKKQMKWCSIIGTIASLVFIGGAINGNKGILEDFTWVIIPIGTLVFTGIYFNMKSLIQQYEDLTK
jgi:hypothetical protein